MNLVIDLGNSRIKTAVFEQGIVGDKKVFQHLTELYFYLDQNTFSNVIISSVRNETKDIINKVKVTGKRIELTNSTALPIKISYNTPGTLGVDRIAAACGAFSLFAGHPCLAIDAGTCINYEFITADGEYLGGAISPGMRMRFTAMNQLTARLPLVEPDQNPPLTGKSTAECLQSGVMNGIAEEIKGTISRYESKYPRLKSILCGGDAGFFENTLKPSIFAAPDLVLIGLNRILLHHAT